MSDTESTPLHPTTAAMNWLEMARAASVHSEGAQDAQDAEQEHEILVIHCDASAYGISIDQAREIIRARALTPVPRSPGWLLGVVSLRGDMVEVVDLRTRLGSAVVPPTRQSRIVILRVSEDQIAGVLVDAVEGVHRFQESELLPAPDSDSGAIEHMVVRDEAFVSILDLQRVLEVNDD